MNNELALQLPTNVDFGTQFTRMITAYNLKSEDLDEVKARCSQYLITLLRELLKRIPSNMLILKTSIKLCRKLILNTIKKTSLEDLPIALLDTETDLTEIENQLRKLPFIDWSLYFANQVMESSTAFWSNVRLHKDNGGSQPFEKLAKFALKIVSLPFSNAVVERVFSVMNATKTKPRNKMNFTMLDAILRIRMHFYTRKMCCQSFVPSEIIYAKFTSKMYDIKHPATKSTPGTSDKPEDCFDEVMTLFVEDNNDIV